MYKEISIQGLFDTNETIAKELMESVDYPWEVLPKIHDFILELGKKLDPEEYVNVRDGVWLAKDAKITMTSSITGPVIIDHGAELRHGSFVRGNAIIGRNAVVGNSTELKNVILFNNVQVPHYNYVGDSILGFGAHMGAGAITSNVKADRSLVEVKASEKVFKTGIKKVGAFLGDKAEIGCNCVLNPGTIIGKNTNVYPLSSIRGIIPSNSIYKKEDDIIIKNNI